MRILVYDVAAEDGGGLFILKKFYKDVIERKPDNIEWIFVVSKEGLMNREHVKVLTYKSIKKSKINRILFDCFTLPKLIKEVNPTVIISLQNTTINIRNIKQYVYLHQSLQYCMKQFSFLKKDERALAIRQQIICGSIYRKSLPKAEHVFVQTEWIKDATVKWLNYPQDKIEVVPVSIDWDSIPLKEYKGENSRIFFYPARAEKYKNHEIIINACQLLYEQGIRDFRVVFTINPVESAYGTYLKLKARNLPIDFIGEIKYEEIWENYSKSILLFSSYLETCGLPLIEGRIAGSRIIAADMPFSHEALDSYPNVQFFSFDNAEQLAASMKLLLYGELEYVQVSQNEKHEQDSLMEKMLSVIQEGV